MVVSAAARIIEQQASAPLMRGPVEQRGRLAAFHVGHVARKEDQRRTCAFRVTEGDPPAIGHVVKPDIAHVRDDVAALR